MKDWFEGLETRERMILLAGGVLAVTIVWWGLIWTPLSGRNVELAAAVVEKQRMLATLQRARATTASVPQIDAATRQSLVLLVDQTHRAFGLEGRLLRTQPDGTDGIRVTFQEAAFDGLIGWLGTMQTSYGIAVESATIDGTRGAGIINATIVLRRI